MLAGEWEARYAVIIGYLVVAYGRSRNASANGGTAVAGCTVNEEVVMALQWPRGGISASLFVQDVRFKVVDYQDKCL